VNWWNKIKQHPKFIRTVNWEFWPTKSFWFPLWIYGPIMAIRSGHPCYFTAANPGIYTGGLGFESKFTTIMLIPEQYRPKTIIISRNSNYLDIPKALKDADIQFPLIIKPDIGFRGVLVKKCDTLEEVILHLSKNPIDFIIQDFIDYESEFGILYYRLPGSKKGHITSITTKDFLFVTGNGRSTVRFLMQQKNRTILQIERIEKSNPDLLKSIPKKGEKISLGEIGNHSKGTTFLDGNHLINEKLHAVFDKISPQIKGIYYGRFDIKARDIEAVENGKFKIIEINGLFAEPTHIYDPQHSSYFKAVSTIMKHSSIVRKIAVKNHSLGTPYMPLKDMLLHIKKLKKYLILVDCLDKETECDVKETPLSYY